MQDDMQGNCAQTLLQAFCTHSTTIRNEDRDFWQWHKGRERYLVWMIRIDDRNWCALLKQAQAWMVGFLLPGYRRNPHVTILPAGFAHAGCIDTGRLQQMLSGQGRFPIMLDGMTSFTGSPCFHVLDPQRALFGLRQLLRTVMADSEARVPDHAYHPHMTIGLYRDRFTTADVAARIRHFSHPPVQPVSVNRLALGMIDARSVTGPIDIVAKFRFTDEVLEVDSHHDLFC